MRVAKAHEYRAVAKGPDWWINRASVILGTTLEEERFPVDVERLALKWTPGLDPTAHITRVAARELEGFEGALVDAPRLGKGWGITCAKRMTGGRHRFTVEHELGHHLLHRHRAPESGFNFRQEDMATWDHERSPQEADANRFAARPIRTRLRNMFSALWVRKRRASDLPVQSPLAARVRRTAALGAGYRPEHATTRERSAGRAT